MSIDPADGRSLAHLAALLADRTRAGMCLALLDGRAWTAGELARVTGVAASTASDHLTQLVTGGLLTEVRQGRHRYVRLASPGTAQLIEDLAGYAPPDVAAPSSLRAVTTRSALASARTCYDHLAGRLGVLIADAMTDRGLLDQSAGCSLTTDGLRWFQALDIDVHALRSGRRPLVRCCLDWTERRPHLAGSAGAALCEHFFDRGWIERTRRHRAVRITDDGHRTLHGLLGLTPDQLDAPCGRLRPASSGG